MAIRDVVVTARIAERLFCPYTGKKVEVHMYVQPGSITFCAPGAFTLSEPVDSMKVLLQRSTMRNGVSGVVPVSKGAVDLFTGRRLQVREFPDGRCCYVGGFNPRAACPTLGEFVYRYTMRDGKATMPKPKEMKAERVERRPPPPKKDVDPSAETVKAAEKAVDKANKAARR